MAPKLLILQHNGGFLTSWGSWRRSDGGGDLLDFDLIWLQKWMNSGWVVTKSWESHFFSTKSIGNHKKPADAGRSSQTRFSFFPEKHVPGRGGKYVPQSQMSQGGQHYMAVLTKWLRIISFSLLLPQTSLEIVPNHTRHALSTFWGGIS